MLELDRVGVVSVAEIVSVRVIGPNELAAFVVEVS